MDRIINIIKYIAFISTDASGFGYGIYCNGVAFSGYWSVKMLPYAIHIKEALTVLMGIIECRHLLTGKNVKLYCDNSAFVAAYLNRWSKDNVMMQIIYKLVLICVKFKILLYIEYINTKNNIIADLLSRIKYDKYKQYCNINGFPMISHKQINNIDKILGINMHKFVSFLNENY